MALYHHSIAGCLSSAIGSHGLDKSTIWDTAARLTGPLRSLKDDYANGRLALLRLPEATDDIVAAETALAKISNGADTIVFFGTGGSGLGGQTLAQFAGWNIPGVDGANRGGDRIKYPRTRFYDNVDAGTLAAALATLDLASTRFVITSKSGGTVETLVQAVAALAAVKAAGLEARIPDLFLGITEPAKAGVANGLRALFTAHSIPMLAHETEIGGRFSVLTNVGLLPALARGVDVRALRRGAAETVAEMCRATQPLDCPAAVGAAVSVALRETKGVSVQVMMPYADRLARFAEWFVQLWAESLGKGGHGTTPVACLGPLDQHSQLQLFMDGPREHLITIVRVAPETTTPRLDPDLCRAAGIGFMADRRLGELVEAQAHAVPEALARAGRPVRTFDLPVLDEAALGGLLMHFMLETIFAAALLNIDAFDQPAVELAKVLTREKLGGGKASGAGPA